MGIDPTYFWDDMTMEEFNAIAEAKGERYREEWEKVRIISYNSAAGYLKKGTTMKKFMPFSWDSEAPKNKAKPSKKRMDAIIKAIYNGK